jgi:hypothetical protein
VVNKLESSTFPSTVTFLLPFTHLERRRWRLHHAHILVHISRRAGRRVSTATIGCSLARALMAVGVGVLAPHACKPMASIWARGGRRRPQSHSRSCPSASRRRSMAPPRSPLLESCSVLARMWLHRAVSRRCYGDSASTRTHHATAPHAYPSHDGDPWQQLWCREVASCSFECGGRQTTAPHK